MLKRTTISLESSIYEALIKESVTRYGDARHLSVIINEKLRKRQEDYSKLFQMAKRKKTNKETANEFEDFRANLSREFER
jgi:3-hydroxy-3-methylglutaryl CoA synthase